MCFTFVTMPANLKIQLKPSMSEIRNYLVANPIHKNVTLHIKKLEFSTNLHFVIAFRRERKKRFVEIRSVH